jgi:Uma2 family endonuclease
MTRVQLTKGEVAPTRLVLNVEKVGLTEEQIFQLCSDNCDLFMELTAQKELIIMAPNRLNSSARENVLCYHLTDWALKDGTGIICGPTGGYKLPNGAICGPDASWVRKGRLAASSEEELEKFGRLGNLEPSTVAVVREAQPR